ncbi:hypothetical protein H5410_009877 [Solanum commersonii]|uniref:Uncharacterized protein n=1 Tax=Solanum commersonii TaxID=4109 RepID=A0A9J6AK07_SOLCO|nr:hypothetical protein H5410_009877 [Solanum commersonii]
MDTVAQVWSPQGWDLIFRRALNDWEVDRVAGLLHTLNAFPGVTESPDTPIWKMHKKGIFFCEVLKACLTHEVLQRRGIQICSRTTANLWDMFLCILGVNWWEGVGRRRRSKEDWWKCIPACIWWTLWKERNERSHDGKLNSTQKIKMNSLSLLYFWCKQDLVGEASLKASFPDLFSLSLQKVATVKEMRDAQGWNLKFRRP